jgi:hypothetical protein
MGLGPTNGHEKHVGGGGVGDLVARLLFAGSRWQATRSPAPRGFSGERGRGPRIVRIEEAIKSILLVPDGWLRLERVGRIPAGLELSFGLYNGKRGEKMAPWRIKCLGVRAFRISDFDGGGIGLYSSAHPAARQFVARQAVLRWAEGPETTGALWRAHIDEVDDWIEMDPGQVLAIAKGKPVCRGPDFLMRAYARALRRIGASPQLTLQKKRTLRKRVRPRVLHFGNSFVVANSFVAEPQP